MTQISSTTDYTDTLTHESPTAKRENYRRGDLDESGRWQFGSTVGCPAPCLSCRVESRHLLILPFFRSMPRDYKLLGLDRP
jgi:hypothetical protein